jgi:Zn-dependent membrane protease YugP
VGRDHLDEKTGAVEFSSENFGSASIAWVSIDAQQISGRPTHSFKAQVV